MLKYQPFPNNMIRFKYFQNSLQYAYIINEYLLCFFISLKRIAQILLSCNKKKQEVFTYKPWSEGYTEHPLTAIILVSLGWLLFTGHVPGPPAERNSSLNLHKEMHNLFLPIKTSLFVLFSSSFHSTAVSSRS